MKEREESQRKDLIIQFQNWTTTILCINKNSSQTKNKRESLAVQVGSPHFHCGGQGFNPSGGETRIPHIMQPQNKQTKKRIGKYLMTLNWMLKMVKMVNFMLYAFYHNKKYFRGKKGKVKYFVVVVQLLSHVLPPGNTKYFLCQWNFFFFFLPPMRKNIRI